MTNHVGFEVVSDQLRSGRPESKYRDLKDGRTVFVERDVDEEHAQLVLRRLASAAYASQFRMRRRVHVLEGRRGYVVWWVQGRAEEPG